MFHTCISTSTQRILYGSSVIQCFELVKCERNAQGDNVQFLPSTDLHVHRSLPLLLFVADSQSQISVTSTMKVVLIGKLQNLQFNDFHKAKLLF